jgi:hypothetical protein
MFKTERSKREKIFNIISNIIDLVQENWKIYTSFVVAFTSLIVYVYVVFFWLDTVESIELVVRYF